MSSPDWVLLARLVRPQGRKGEIIAEIYTDFPERFKERPRVFLAPAKAHSPTREALIEKYWMHQGRVVLKFHGIDSINDAETLRGLDVIVPAEERVPLKDDSVYIGDLVGCRLLDVAGPEAVDIGEIVDVERSQAPAPDLLVVRPRTNSKAGKSEPLLIPFAKSYLVAVDVAEKRLTMRLPAGLAELNTAAASEEAGEQ
jgi:16S rRNA processing protein RimM